MNDHELDLALVDMGARHVQVRVPPALREQVRAVPLQAPRPRAWLPRSPKWRFQSMFSATKFLVAGAIVALFGGFLLAASLPRPDDSVQAPAAVSDSPEPTPDLLPGVDLVTEEVRPGVHLVLGDGEHSLSRNLRDVIVAPDGAVYLTKSTAKPRLIRLGVPGAEIRRDRGVFEMRVDDDGELIVWHGDHDPRGSRTARLFKGPDWAVTVIDDDFESCLDGIPHRGALGVDGRCWDNDWGVRVRAISSDGSSVRYDADSVLSRRQLSELGAFLGHALLRGAGVTDDGAVWTAVIGADGPLLGFASYAQGAWSFVPFPGTGSAGDSPRVGSAFVGPDDNLWVTIQEEGPGPSEPAAIGWDGEEWHVRGAESALMAGFPGAQSLPDGRVVLDSPYLPDDVLGIVDGSTYRVWDPLGIASDDHRYHSLSIAPDGSLWVVTGGAAGASSLYVITPEAIAAGE